MKRALAHALALLLVLAQMPAARAASPARDTRRTPAPSQQQSTPQQQPSPTPTPTPAQQDEDDVVRITSNLVQFDAVVVDRQGRLVTDLRPEEFEVLLEGKRQEISNFSFVAATPPAATPERAPDARPDKGAPPPPPLPPARLSAGQVRRTIALVVDDLGTSATDLYYVKRALKKFVDEQMQPGDLAAVIQTGKGLGALQQFTSDRRLLHRAIDGVRWNPSGRAGLSSFAPAQSVPPLVQADGASGGNPTATQGSDMEAARSSDPATALEEFRENVFTVGTLGALDFIVRGMKELPGRKSAILFSGGFPIFNAAGDNERVLERLRRLTDQANRASVVIYTMDARGIAITSLTAADSVSNAREALRVLQTRSDELVSNREGLSYLAEQTGGLFIRNTNDLGAGVKRILEDQKGYYLIGFHPEAEVFERADGRTRFNKFKVRVTRPGTRVRTRAGFYGFAEGEAKPAPRTRAEQMLAALSSPLTSGGLALRLTSLFNSPVEGAVIVDSLLHVDGGQLQLADEPGGWKRAVFDVVALTYGENGQVVDEINRTETVRVRGDALEALLRDGLVYVMKVPLKRPGAYQLRVAVRDAASERVGSANQFIEVPDLKKGRLALSGIFMTGAGPAAAPEKSDANATPAGQAGEGASDPLLDGTVRQFRQGAAVDFRFHIYNAKVEGASGRTRLQTQTRLFHDGQPVYQSPPQPFDPGSQPSSAARLEAGRRLQLGTQLPPGQYVLQVVVTDELARGKTRTATQWIDFEIIK